MKTMRSIGVDCVQSVTVDTYTWIGARVDLTVPHHRMALVPDTARELAQALLAAADEIDPPLPDKE